MCKKETITDEAICDRLLFVNAFSPSFKAPYIPASKEEVLAEEVFEISSSGASASPVKTPVKGNSQSETSQQTHFSLARPLGILHRKCFKFQLQGVIFWIQNYILFYLVMQIVHLLMQLIFISTLLLIKLYCYLTPLYMKSQFGLITFCHLL